MNKVAPGWNRFAGISRPVAAAVLGLLALLMLFARPANFYWAMLITPTLFVGLAFAPAALAALARSLWRPARALSAAA